MNMFCYQCEQTSQGTGCTSIGICGKTPEVAKLQDVMVHLVKGISVYAHAARALGLSDAQVNEVTLAALFMTLTNVNFDEDEHVSYIKFLGTIRDRAKIVYKEACKNAGSAESSFTGAAVWELPATKEGILNFADSISIIADVAREGTDIVGLREMLIYGIKGLAAYAHHASEFGYKEESIYAFVHEALAYVADGGNDAGKLLAMCLKAGEVNFKVMELLDRAHTETLGHPVPTPVLTSVKKGKCILISGHDMKCLLELLKQTEGKGINIYTHGEMLPAHSYPELKKFKHLVANYGGAWQEQVKEFNEFPGPILMTTNCLKPPADSYKDRLFTTVVTGWTGAEKLKAHEFSKLIESAQNCPGFSEDTAEKSILIGFGRNAVLSVADKVVGAVKDGAIKHFFLIGGCDGAEFARNYYTEFAEQVPKDCVIMTLGCAKYRFNNIDFGTIGGIPRLLDLGQCNDSYSAVMIALALADAFKCEVNDLPLSLIISWFEQKAVAVLLTLLYLGIKDIRLGPNLPGFVSQNILKQLVEGYQLKAISKPAQDLAEILK